MIHGNVQVTNNVSLNDFIVAENATFKLGVDSRATINQGKNLTISGQGTFSDRSTITLDARAHNTTLFVNGTLVSTGATITSSFNWYDSLLQVSDIGVLEATNTTFSMTTLQLIDGATLEPGLWSGNRFDTILNVPWQVVPFLSAAHGGSDNVRFREIRIQGGTLPANAILDLSVIGTDPNANANLRYSFIDHFVVSPNATLNLNASAKAVLYPGKRLTISGRANFQENAIFTFDARAANTTLFVGVFRRISQ